MTVHLKMEAACTLWSWATSFRYTEELTLNSIVRFSYTIFNNLWSLSDNYALRTNVLLQNLWNQVGNIWRIIGSPLYLHPCIWFDHLIKSFHSGVAVPITFSVKVVQPLQQGSQYQNFPWNGMGSTTHHTCYMEETSNHGAAKVPW
jgi:hypothetical protein